MQLPDGSLQAKTRGTMQGGVISPILSNLFLHYGFDMWMKKNHPTVPWCRYADDGLAHCETEQQAQQLLVALEVRFAECGLELHPDKTKIIYCKDSGRSEEHSEVAFDFLGYGFRCRTVKNSKTKQLFSGFTPAVSKPAIKAMRQKTRNQKFYRRTDLSLNDIVKEFNPVLRGWIEYYGKYNRSALKAVFGHFNKTLVEWARRKYKKFRSKTRATKLIEGIAKREPQLFAHWKIGMVWAFA